MKKLTAILDAVSIFYLFMLLLTLWFNVGGEIVGLLLLAILVGTIVHLLRSYGDAFALLFVAYLWVAVAMNPPLGVWEPTAWEWTLAIIVNLSFFSCPVVYFFWIRKPRYRTYFKVCAWIWILGSWTPVLYILIEVYRSDALPTLFGEIFEEALEQSAQILLFVPVLVYLTYRLIMGTQKRRPAEVASG